MKKIFKRYRFALVMAAVIIILSAIAPETGLKSIRIAKDNVLQMLSVIPPIFVLLGLLDVWVDRATMMKYTGKGSGLKGIFISFLLGSCAAGPLYAAFPIATVMLKKGSSVFNMLIFLGAWSTTKVPMLTFEATNLGLKFTIIRLCLSITGIMLIAFISERSLSPEETEQMYELSED